MKSNNDRKFPLLSRPEISVILHVIATMKEQFRQTIRFVPKRFDEKLVLKSIFASLIRSVNKFSS